MCRGGGGVQVGGMEGLREEIKIHNNTLLLLLALRTNIAERVCLCVCMCGFCVCLQSYTQTQAYNNLCLEPVCQSVRPQLRTHLVKRHQSAKAFDQITSFDQTTSQPAISNGNNNNKSNLNWKNILSRTEFNKRQ